MAHTTTDVTDFAEGVRLALAALDRAHPEAIIADVRSVRQELVRQRMRTGTPSIAMLHGVDSVITGMRELERYRELHDRLVRRAAVQP